MGVVLVQMGCCSGDGGGGHNGIQWHTMAALEGLMPLALRARSWVAMMGLMPFVSRQG